MPWWGGSDMTREQREKYLKEYIKKCKEEKGEYTKWTLGDTNRIVAKILEIAERN